MKEKNLLKTWQKTNVRFTKEDIQMVSGYVQWLYAPSQSSGKYKFKPQCDMSLYPYENG